MVTRRPIITKTVTDDQAEQHTSPLLAPMMAGVVVREPRKKPEPEQQPKPKPDEPKPKFKPARDELGTFLQAILDNPFDTVTERKDRFGWSGYKANRIKNEAVHAGFAVELRINMGRRTRGRVLLMQLTAKGYERLSAESPDTPGFRMSPEHWWWQCGIARYLGSLPDTQVEIEFSLKGKRIDVAAVRGDSVHAFEVEMTPDNAVRNAKADLEAGATHVTIACRDVRVQKAIGERLTGAVSGTELTRMTLTTLGELPVGEFLFGKGKEEPRGDGLFPDLDRHDERHTIPINRALVIQDQG